MTVVGGFHVDLGLKTAVVLNSGVGSLRKCHLRRILRQKSSKSSLSFGSFILF